MWFFLALHPMKIQKHPLVQSYNIYKSFTVICLIYLSLSMYRLPRKSQYLLFGDGLNVFWLCSDVLE